MHGCARVLLVALVALMGMVLPAHAQACADPRPVTCAFNHALSCCAAGEQCCGSECIPAGAQCCDEERALFCTEGNECRDGECIDTSLGKGVVTLMALACVCFVSLAVIGSVLFPRHAARAHARAQGAEEDVLVGRRRARPRVMLSAGSDSDDELGDASAGGELSALPPRPSFKV